MKETVIRIRDMISSNVSQVLDSVESPLKLTRMLKHQIESAIIAQRKALASHERHAADLAAKLSEIELSEAAWTDKAALAMQNDREDLARSALIEREKVKLVGQELRKTIAVQDAVVAEGRAALADLDRRHGEAATRVAEIERAEAIGAAPVVKHVDKADALADRLAFIDGAAPADGLSDEIAALATEKAIDAEIEKLRQKAQAPAKGKR